MKYPWPASAITPEDMSLLHRVRECGPERTPITELLARAVRETYGQTREVRRFHDELNPLEKAA